MNKLLRNKKDFSIAIIFTILIVYAIISHFFSIKIQNWLLSKGNFRMTDMNQPKGLGSLAFTFWFIGILLFIILWIFKKSLKQALIALCIAAAVGTISFVCYFMECNMIASVIGNENPVLISANGWGNENYHLVMNEEQEKELIAYCEQLEPLTGKEQREFQKEFLASDGQMTGDCLLIWIEYPKKYGHNFALMVCVYQDNIYIRKGYDNHQKEIAVGCKDNGLLAFIDKVNQ